MLPLVWHAHQPGCAACRASKVNGSNWRERRRRGRVRKGWRGVCLGRGRGVERGARVGCGEQRGGVGVRLGTAALRSGTRVLSLSVRCSSTTPAPEAVSGSASGVYVTGRCGCAGCGCVSVRCVWICVWRTPKGGEGCLSAAATGPLGSDRRTRSAAAAWVGRASKGGRGGPKQRRGRRWDVSSSSRSSRSSAGDGVGSMMCDARRAVATLS